MYRNKIKSIIIVFIIIALILSGCSKPASTTNNTLEPTPTEVQPTVEATPEPTPEAESAFKCSLTGVDLENEADNKSRPIAVMLDNQAIARPQSGLNSAEIVYEFPVEGKITRYMAIYHHQSADKIGPVRSARPYFLDKAMEYNAIYVHCGGSEQALSDIQTLKLDTLNELQGDPAFWRSKDRSAPHNLYTSVKLMRDVMASRKQDNKQAPQLFKFADSAEAFEGKKVSGISINYDKGYKVGYEYDYNDKVFYRLINGVRLKDKETNEAIKTTNIIIEKVSAKVIDSEGRLEIGTVGKGSGFYLTAGKLIEIEWNKSSRAGKTTYKDLKGNEITLNKGNIWIQMVPDYATVEIKE